LLRGVLLVMLLGLAWGARAADDLPASSPQPSIEGDWLVESRDAVIRIQRQGDQYEGRIVWQLHDTYGPEDGPELNGKTVTDRKNPDPSLRSQPLTGLRLLWGLHYDAAHGEWVDGHVYDSDNGKVYQCRVRLLDANRLRLHGFIGITLLGGNTVWSRVSAGTTAGGQARPAAAASTR
jgi:uncharacterized protein (DUF2147 family)